MSERMRIQRKKETAVAPVYIESDTLQRSPAVPQQTVDTVPPIVQEVLSSSGQPLDSATRDFMEPRFGHNFSHVRVHTDERAVESAQAVHASAYTVGNDIVFGDGQYSPDTLAGKQLLTHELTHSVQQSARAYEENPPTSINDFRDAAEQEAYLAPIHLQNTGRIVVQQQVSQPTLYRFGEGENVRQGVHTFTIGIPSFQKEHYSNISSEEAISILRGFHRRITILIDAGVEGHAALIANQHKDIVGRIVGPISDALSRSSLPSMTIWDEPRGSLGSALTMLDFGFIEEAVTTLQQAANEWQENAHKIYAYREGTVSGAEKAVTGLHVLEAVGALAATAATGGIAAGAEMGAWGTATATGLVGGAYGATQTTAEQGSELFIGLREHWDIGEIVKRGVSEAVTGFISEFVGKYAGKQLENTINESFQRYLLEKLSTETLKQMGIPLQVFLHHSLSFIAEFFGDQGGNLLATALNVVVKKYIKERRKPSLDEFADEVVEEMIQDGAFDSFEGMMKHILPSHK